MSRCGRLGAASGEVDAQSGTGVLGVEVRPGAEQNKKKGKQSEKGSIPGGKAMATE